MTKKQQNKFTNSFTVDKLPKWKCPTCKEVPLTCEKIKSYESPSSLSCRHEKNLQSFEKWGIFAGLLKCTNCLEQIVVSGNMQGNFQRRKYVDEDLFEEREIIVDVEELVPTHFNPPIHIFDINKGVPKEIKDEIINAFKLYWLDQNACANKIRIAVEKIMDNKKVRKTFLTNSRKRKRFSAHERIELFKKTNPKVANLLEAIKWIGNAGSHNERYLTKEDVLFGFDMLKLATEKLYDKGESEIIKKSKVINKRKKPIGG